MALRPTSPLCNAQRSAVVFELELDRRRDARGRAGSPRTSSPAAHCPKVFLALSSRGSGEWALSVSNGVLPLTDLSSAELAEGLDETGFKWRVIVISACYAGGFIEALQDPYTIVLAAAASDRTWLLRRA
jgi:hypothetical protein